MSDNQPETRYARQTLLQGWDQARLKEARVLVFGAGALGNEVVKLLVLVGVGLVTVVDFDVVAPSNLARCVFFRDEDVGQNKAVVVANRAHKLNSEVRVVPIAGNLAYELGKGYIRTYDIALGCVDNLEARWEIN